MISSFFVNRPIVAMVISIVMVIIGGVTIYTLPISYFPDITPPTVQVSATYVGADALTIEQAVATPIEQQMSGVDNMDYMYSINANNGSMSLSVTFENGTDPNTDQILAQMRQTQAASQLPADVTAQGVTVTKTSGLPLMLFSVYSKNNSRDQLFLTNYGFINLVDPLKRSYGVADVQVFGADKYAMRLWVKPDRLASLAITVTDIIAAIKQQNTVNPAGQVGGEPIPKGQEFTYAARAQGRLVTTEDFGNIVIRETTSGGTVRLKDIARIELGAQTYNRFSRFDGKPCATLAIYQLPGTNALQTVETAKKTIAELSKNFPDGVDYDTSLDTTAAVSAGIDEIVATLFEAILFVILVIFLFLQSWRATLIPLLAVPVSLIGTFILFPVFGFSINTITLFGLVLAVGLVVDDAIVVVEAVEKHMEEGLAPKEATLKAMEEITGPVIGIALVLSAVFIPTALLPGITGKLYQQFAVTIAVSIILSAFNALTLSPALCALLLKPKKENTRKGIFQRFFDWFNRTFGRITTRYVGICRVLIRRSVIAMLMIGLFGIVSGFFANRIPSSFLPDEDQGYAFVNLQLPNAASMQRNDEISKEVEKTLREMPGVKHVTSVIGFSLLTQVMNTYSSFFFVTLDDWKDRETRDTQYQVIKAKLNQKLMTMPQAITFAFSPPAIPGLGASGGVTFVLQDRSGQDISFLTKNVNAFMAAAAKRPELSQLNTGYLPTVPQVYVDVDREKVLKQGVPLGDVYQTIQAFMGGAFTNYFTRFGRQYQVYVEAEGEYRTNAKNVGEFYVRGKEGDMVPLGSVTNFKTMFGPEYTMRYNLFRSAQITANVSPGYSSAQAMSALEGVFKQTMPTEMGYEYSGMSYQEKKAQEGVPTWAIFAFSFLFVFLILAALYESWSLPFSVLLTVPIAVFGAFGMLWLRRTVLSWILPPYLLQIENNIYAQIGLIMIIGLTAKNAILIVEFAKEEYEKGKPLIDATLAGAQLRLRPILMTSLAFILGVVPLWRASGSGSISRQVMGTVVIGGMLASSLIAIFFVPAGFYVVEKLLGGKQPVPKTPQTPVTESGD